MEKQLRKAILAILGTAALGTTSQAHAFGVESIDLGMLNDGATIVSPGHVKAGPRSWADPRAAGYGWVHTGSSMFKLQVGSANDIANGVPFNVSIKMSAEGIPGTSSMDNPSFTVWTSGTDNFDINAQHFGWHVYDQTSGPTNNIMNAPLTTIGIKDIIGYVNSGNSFPRFDGTSLSTVAKGSANSNTPWLVWPSTTTWESTQTSGLDYALLTMTGLKAGYYLIAAGNNCADGKCAAGTGYGMTITGTIATATVPVPGAAWLFGGAIVGWAGRFGRQSK